MIPRTAQASDLCARTRRGRRKGIVPGLSVERYRVFVQFFRAQPWSSARDLSDALDGYVCAIRVLLYRLHKRGYLVCALRPTPRGGPQTRVYALPGTPDPAPVEEAMAIPPAEPAAPQGDSHEVLARAPAPFAAYRREDGVLVCPPGYPMGYGTHCVTARPRMRREIHTSERL